MAKVMRVLFAGEPIETSLNSELEISGWVASCSCGKSNNFIEIAEKCVKAGHLTPTRSMRFIFSIDEISRSCSHQFVRHEIGVTKCQQSQRYSNIENAGFVMPESVAEKRVYVPSLDKFLYMDDVVNITREWFSGAMNDLDDPVPQEDARYVLTNSEFTKIHVVFNWESLVNFCQKRLCQRAQWEIRDVANQIKALVTEQSEFLGNKLIPRCEDVGYCIEEHCCGRFPRKEDVAIIPKSMLKEVPKGDSDV